MFFLHLPSLCGMCGMASSKDRVQYSCNSSFNWRILAWLLAGSWDAAMGLSPRRNPLVCLLWNRDKHNSLFENLQEQINVLYAMNKHPQTSIELVPYLSTTIITHIFQYVHQSTLHKTSQSLIKLLTPCYPLIFPTRVQILGLSVEYHMLYLINSGLNITIWRIWSIIIVML